ncbi:DUF1045 domain-containing protein [Pararhizobium haloflavum]|uniref:DUF1045 domain-containing protein n=1 Tax=Pararhizobium haloflavum TaxID=2037914 RepID=UPI000C1A6FAD|nr:DUF1045 domain-containing protein [Pararhizobium haloflavum]
MRYALYFTPPARHPLTMAAARWLGRDAFSGKAIESPAVAGLTSDDIWHHTAAPRRYGFHATIKAPFQLAADRSESELLADLMQFCGRLEPFAVPLAINRIGPFFALTPEVPSPALQDLADAVVRRFEPYRAALSEADLERRSSGSLTCRQLEYLQRWGYPFVFDMFRFHMTLTGPIAKEEAPQVEQALAAYFEPLLGEPLDVASLALFIEPESGAPFIVDSLHPMGRVDGRKGLGARAK